MPGLPHANPQADPVAALQLLLPVVPELKRNPAATRRGLAHLRRDPVMASIMQAVGPCRLRSESAHSPFASLARAIAYQQLADANRTQGQFDAAAGAYTSGLKIADGLGDNRPGELRAGGELVQAIEEDRPVGWQKADFGDAGIVAGEELFPRLPRPPCGFG